MHHSCGSIYPIIDDLVELGADILHPIQALAADMDIRKLKEGFDGKVAFCGGVDAQYLLVKGDEGSVGERVREIMEVFPTGLVLSPSHEAILPDIPPVTLKPCLMS
jgi:uroporphyrinogen decarboxylase